MDKEYGYHRESLHDEIPIADGIHAVSRNPIKPQELCSVTPIYGERRPRNRPRAEGKNINPLPAISEPLPVPLKHLHVGQEMVREEHRPPR